MVTVRKQALRRMKRAARHRENPFDAERIRAYLMLRQQSGSVDDTSLAEFLNTTEVNMNQHLRSNTELLYWGVPKTNFEGQPASHWGVCLMTPYKLAGLEPVGGQQVNWAEHFVLDQGIPREGLGCHVVTYRFYVGTNFARTGNNVQPAVGGSADRAISGPGPADGGSTGPAIGGPEPADGGSTGPAIGGPAPAISGSTGPAIGGPEPALGGSAHRPLQCGLCPRRPVVSRCLTCGTWGCQGCIEAASGDCWACLGYGSPQEPPGATEQGWEIVESRTEEVQGVEPASGGS